MFTERVGFANVSEIFLSTFQLTNGTVRQCFSDAAGGKAKLAIVSMSAWQLTLHGPSMTFC